MSTTTSSTTWTEIAGTAEAPVVRLRRRYDATVDEVWSACTERDRLARWLATMDGDLVPGDTRRVRLGAEAPAEGGDVATWEVRRVTPYVVEIGWNDHADPDGTVTISLRPDPDDPAATELTLEHALAPLPTARAHAASFGAGWEGLLAGLGAHLAGGDLAAVKAADRAVWDSRQEHWKTLLAGRTDGTAEETRRQS